MVLVDGPVRAIVGEVTPRLLPYREPTPAHHYDDISVHPWAVGVSCRVTFVFGKDRLRTTKSLFVVRRPWPDHREVRPPQESIDAEVKLALMEMQELLYRHDIFGVCPVVAPLEEVAVDVPAVASDWSATF